MLNAVHHRTIATCVIVVSHTSPFYGHGKSACLPIGIWAHPVDYRRTFFYALCTHTHLGNVIWEVEHIYLVVVYGAQCTFTIDENKVEKMITSGIYLGKGYSR